MTPKISIKPEAEADIADACRWYRERAQELDTGFLQAVDSCLSAIQRNPEAFPIVHRRIRRALMRKFPLGSSISSRMI